MAGLPIPAEAELDQIFGGSDDEDDNMLLPLTRTATASDLLDEEFPNSSDDKAGTSLLMDVLVQRPTGTEDEHAEEEGEKPDRGGKQLSSVKSEREGRGGSEDRRYGLRDRRTTRKRPPQDAAVFGEEHPPRKATKESKSEQMVAPESGEEGEGEGEEEDDEEDESDSDAVYCICRQPHGGRFMICCDRCEEWYHGTCVGISVAQGKRMEKEAVDYVCPACKDKEKQQKLLVNKESKEKRADMRDQQKQKNMAQGSPKAKVAQQKDVKSPSTLKSPERRKSVPDTKEDKRPQLKSPTKKLKDVNGKQRLDKLAEDRRRFLMGDAAPDRGAMKKCTVSACTNLVIPPTLYCSDSCVERYAAEAINTLLEYGVSFHGGISLIDTATGKVIMYATSRTNLVPFLKQHRSYMVHLPSGPNPMKRQPASGSTSEGQSEEERKGENLLGGKAEDELEQKESAMGKAGGNAALPSKAPRNPEELRQQAKKALYFTLLKRVQESEDLKDMDKSPLEEMGAEIEESLFAVHKDVNHRYKARYRQLLFNLKDEKNEVLFRKVVHKEIKTSQLVLMSHDQLASEELSKWREEELKKNIEAIKERESKVHAEPIRKITKKGEEEIEQNYESTPVEGDLPKQLPVLEARTPGDTTSEHGKHLFDANCDICQGKVVRAPEVQEVAAGDEEGKEGATEPQRSNTPSPPIGAAASPVGVADNWSPSSLEVSEDTPPVKQEEVRSPKPAPPPANKEDLRAMARKQLTRVLQARAKVVDGLMEVDSATWQNIAEGAEQALYARFCELDVRYKNQYRVILAGLKDRANGYLLRKIAQGDVKASQLATMSREELEPPLWVGHIHQQGLTKFLARAHRVSGNCARLPEAMPELLNVVGRISFRDVWSYLEKVKQTPTKTIAVLRFEWLGEERGPYMSLLDYLVGRQRIGVIDVRGTNLKDFYVVPLLSGEELPKAVRDLRGPGLGSGNSGDQLLGVVVRTDSHHGQPPPPPPPPRKPHSHRSHWHSQQHKAEGSKPSKSDVNKKEKFVVEVGIGDRTPPLPGEAGSPSVTTPGVAIPAAASSDNEPVKPVITMYRSAEASEPLSLSGAVEEQVSASEKEEVSANLMAGPTVEGSRSEEECIISESSLSPPSSLGEEEEVKEKEGATEASDDAMEVGEVTAYSPSAPLEDEPYSPSHDAALEEEDVKAEEEKMDTDSKEESALELPYSPETAAVEGVEGPSTAQETVGADGGATDTSNDQLQQGGAFSLVSSFISSKVTGSGPLQDTRQPSQSSDVTTSISDQGTSAQNSSVEQSGSNSSNLSNAQLQNLLAKLPILAQSILGQSAATPSHTSASPSSLTGSSTSQVTGVGSTSVVAPPPPSSIPVLGGGTTRTSWSEPSAAMLYDSQGPPHKQFPGLSDSEEGVWHSHMGWHHSDPRQQRQEQEGWR